MPNGGNKISGGNGVGIEPFVHQTDQILGHDTLIQGGEAGVFQLAGKGGQISKTVKLTPLAQCACPCKDGGNRVSGGLLFP